MRHFNGILAQVGGNLNNNFQKRQMPGGLPGGGGGMLKLRFDRYIRDSYFNRVVILWNTLPLEIKKCTLLSSFKKDTSCA